MKLVITIIHHHYHQHIRSTSKQSKPKEWPIKKCSHMTLTFSFPWESSATPVTSYIQTEIRMEINLTSKLHISVIIFGYCLSFDLNLVTHVQYTHLDVSANSVNECNTGNNSFHQL